MPKPKKQQKRKSEEVEEDNDEDVEVVDNKQSDDSREKRVWTPLEVKFLKELVMQHGDKNYGNLARLISAQGVPVPMILYQRLII